MENTLKEEKKTHSNCRHFWGGECVLEQWAKMRIYEPSRETKCRYYERGIDTGRAEGK